MSVAPSDAAARDRIVADHASTLFVEAGAGSGKTSSLVGRFVALVLAGADVAGIAAITFTEAAAAELRARIREALEDVAAGHPVRGITTDEHGPERARQALDRLDRATIATLHAFAQRLLLSAPVEAGLPPRVEVHDEISSSLRTEDRWARFERRLLDDDDLEVTLRAALALGIKIEHLESVAATLGQNWDLVQGIDLTHALDDAVDLESLEIRTDPLFAAADQIRALAPVCTDPDDKLLAWIEHTMPDKLGPLAAATGDPYTLLQAVTGDEFKITTHGKKGCWPDDTKPLIGRIWNDAVGEMMGHVDRLKDHILSTLSAHLAAYTLAEAAARRTEGRLEFHDLLVLAREVLRRDEGVRRRMHERYRHLLIDEFQDTDPIQVELAVRIAADPGHDTELPWDQVEVEEGRLFFVGDPKQSIYRFRRADIDLFARTAARHAAGATTLDTNFRTVPSVVEFCNELFGRLIVATTTKEDDEAPPEVAQPEYVPLQPWRRPVEGDPGPPVVLFGGPETDARAETLRAAEATDVAGLLGRAHTEGWLVQPDSDEARPCRWSDMAVLLPSRSSLAHLRRALDDAAVPYRLETGSLVYSTTEIRDLLSILRAIDDPGDAVSLVGALRSPAYGCGDDDLRRWVAGGRNWSYFGEHDPASGDPVERALADLRDRHRTRPFRTVPEIIDAVVRERRLMEISIAGGRHRDAWRLYRVVIEHARQFADAESGGLRAFLRWAELQADDKRRVTVPVLPEADLDAVRVLTVHGSKGLEFGIVAVSGLSGQFPRSGRGAVVRFRPEGGFDVRMRSGLETAQFDRRRTVEDVMGEHEGIRLLYVALTRARDHLAVSLHHKPSKSSISCHAQRIQHVVDELASGWDPAVVERVQGTSSRRDDHLDRPERPIEAVAPVGGGVSDDERRRWEADETAWVAERRALLVAARAGGATSATALARQMADDAGGAEPGAGELADDRPEPEREPWRRGRAGTAVGSAVHAVLQHTDLTDPTGADLTALAAWQAQVEGVPDAAADIEAKARAALSSALVRGAVDGGRWWREVHVAAPVEGAGDIDLVEGFVDLLFDDGDGLVVVDYKTDAVPDERALRQALDRYAPQGAAYAVAVEAATGRPVRAVHFLFLRGSDAVTATVDDLEGHTQRVRDVLAKMSS